MILAIAGTVNGVAPTAGATPTFTLSLGAYALFHEGLVGDTGIKMSNTATADSFDPTTGLVGQQSKVLTNGKLTKSGSSSIQGDATAVTFSVGSSASITGTSTALTGPATFMAVKVPAGIPTLANIALSGIALYAPSGPLRLHALAEALFPAALVYLAMTLPRERSQAFVTFTAVMGTLSVGLAIPYLLLAYHPRRHTPPCTPQARPPWASAESSC